MDGWITLGAELDTKNFDAQIEDVESKLATLEKRWEETNKMPSFEGKNEDLQNLSLQIEKLSNKLIILKKKQQDVNAQGLDKLGNSVGKISDGMSNILTKVAKWGLALFSVRTAYSLIRNAITTISENNDQMKANIDYMRFALAMSLKPIVEWLVNAVQKLMTYVNYISQAWFGYNLFKDAGVEDFEKSLNKSNKTAKELKKTLMGFDEANVIQDTSSASGGGTTLPSFDLSKVEQIDVPDWVKWIADNKDTIIQLAEIVGIAFGIGKVTSILNNIATLFGVAGPAGGVGGVGLRGLFSSLGAIAIITGGILITYLCAKKVWDDLQRLGDEIDEISKKQQKFNQEFTKSIDPAEEVEKLTDKTNVNITSGNDLLEDSQSWWAKISGTSDKFLTTASRVTENTSVTLEKAKQMFVVEGRTKEEKEKILDALKKQKEYNLDVIATMDAEHKDTTQLKIDNQKLNDAIYIMSRTLDDTSEIIEYNRDKTKESRTEWEILSDAVKNGKTNIEELNKTKLEDKNMKVNVDINKKDAKLGIQDILAGLGAIKGVMAGVGLNINPIMLSIQAMYNKFKSSLKLATGGIVNLPNRGVPLGNVITGEAGREGVIPLTDPTAMAQLGKEIGQWVNVAIDNKMVVDGRVLATAMNTQANRERLLLNR